MSLQFIKLDDSDTGMLLVWSILSSALVWPMKGRPYFMFSTHVVDFLEARQKFAASLTIALDAISIALRNGSAWAHDCPYLACIAL